MKLGLFRVILDPEPPPKPRPAPCLLRLNIRVKGFRGATELDTDQYIRRPIEHVYDEAVLAFIGATDGNRLNNDWRVAAAWPLDDYGSICFNFEYFGDPSI